MDEYVFKQNKLLNKLKNYDQIIGNIVNKFKVKNISYKNILYILKYIDPFEITYLHAPYNANITNAHVIYLTNLTYLNVSDNINITDVSIKKLINLTYLDASYNDNITDTSVIRLTKLTHLNASNNKNITYEAIKKLTNLT